jgi:hypothetical protein
MRKVTFPFLPLIYREYPFTILKIPDDGNKSSIEFILIMPNKLNRPKISNINPIIVITKINL